MSDGLVVDLFAGPGGWDEGLLSLGIRRVVGLEVDDAACLTRSAAGHHTIRCDVSRYPVQPFRHADGLIGSPPCKVWSMAGKGAGRRQIELVLAAIDACRDGWNPAVLTWAWEDPGTPLILEPLRWAWTIRPQWMAFEQVPPALEAWRHMARVLQGWGYDAHACILNAADYGVPQTRKRAFLLARRGKVRLPVPTHSRHPEPCLFGDTKEPWVTMAEALGWGMSARPALSLALSGSTSPIGGTGAFEAVKREQGAGRWVLRGNQKPPGWDEYHSVAVDRPAQSLTGNTGAYKWVYDRPATTLVGTFRPDIVAPPGGHDRSTNGESRQDLPGAVQITVEEAAVLQSFRPDYPFRGSKSKRYEQVGNVVPPLLARAVVASLVS